MRLIEVSERQTGYLMFIRSNRVSQLVFHPYSILAQIFPGRKMPLQNS